jgi:hypothetical protein
MKPITPITPITQFRAATLLVALAAGMTATTTMAQAGNTTGCTPQEKSAQQQLGKTQGVICPPDVDPAMKKPAPNTGTMPVVPPPGTPGGNPNVQAK